MQPCLTLESFSELLGHLYQGPLENTPWDTFLNQLNLHLRSKYVTFILRPPSAHVDGLMVNTTGSSSETTASYNKHFFALDPENPAAVLAALPGQVVERVLAYTRSYRPDGMRSNYGVTPAVDQVLAAKGWIEAQRRQSA